MLRVLNCLTVEHDLRLVAVAVLVCLLTSLTAVILLRRASETEGRSRRNWLLLAGMAAGTGIWATHFVAMLAYSPGVNISFEVDLTVLSLAVSIAVTTLAFALAVSVHARWSIVAAGALLGLGISAMHYLGMAALQIPGFIIWSTDLVIASIVSSMVFGIAAIWATLRQVGTRAYLSGAIFLTLAIASLHFTAMGAVGVIPDSLREITTFAFSSTALALVIAALVAGILSVNLVVAFADQKIEAQAEGFTGRIQALVRDRKRLIEDNETALRDQNMRLDSAINNMSQGLSMFDRDARLVICNRRYREMYGLDEEVTAVGTSLRDLLEIRKSNGTFTGDPGPYAERLTAAMASGGSASLLVELSDGRAISIINQPMKDGGWVATHEDITSQRQAEKHIAYLAHHDALTGLPNRATFNERLEAVLEHARANKNEFAVLCVDLDRFKEINDVFGHAAGDAVLQACAERFERAANGAFVARLGGDEFNVIVPEGPDAAAQASGIADHLLTAFNDALLVGDHEMRVGVSVGIAIFPSDGTDTSTLLANADAALYRSKAEGRGAIRFFEAEMDTRLRERRSMQHEIRGAIERGEMAVYYQPQANMEGQAIGFEALVRWQHPQRGLVSPATFIPLAEESGMIIQIGEWVLRTACREAASWEKPLQIAINLSPVQFQHGDLPTLVHEILLETGLAAERVELEITEGVLINDFSRAVSVLRRLKALGIRIAMDDFGTGYSSLSYLQAFPFDKIKIDHSFISNVERNHQSAAIVRAVIALARGLQMPVLAEGVETDEQVEFLRQEACDEMQGFRLGRPRPIEEYASLTRSKMTPEVPRVAAVA